MVSWIYSDSSFAQILSGETMTDQNGRMAVKTVLVNRFQKKSTTVLISSCRTLSEKFSIIVSVKKSWSIVKKILKLFDVKKISTFTFTTETQPPVLAGNRDATEDSGIRINPAYHIRQFEGPIDLVVNGVNQTSGKINLAPGFFSDNSE